MTRTSHRLLFPYSIFAPAKIDTNYIAHAVFFPFWRHLQTYSVHFQIRDLSQGSA
jgi:hypothetical protein